MPRKPLHEAQEQSYTQENVLSAFEVTGIERFDPYRSPVMQEYLARMKAPDSRAGPSTLSHPAAPPTPRRRRIVATANSGDLLEDQEAPVESLRQALGDMLELVKGSEAQAIVAEARYTEAQASAEERKKASGRSGTAGGSKIWTQIDVLEEMRPKEELLAEIAARRGQGQGRGRGRGAGRDQKVNSRKQASRKKPMSKLDEYQQAESESSSSDFALESEDSS